MACSACAYIIDTVQDPRFKTQFMVTCCNVPENGGQWVSLIRDVLAAAGKLSPGGQIIGEFEESWLLAELVAEIKSSPLDKSAPPFPL